MEKGSCPFHAKAGAAATHSASGTPAPSAHARAQAPGFPAFTLQDELAFLREAAPDASPHALRERTAACERALAAGEPAPLTSDELTWAARIAWRNHARCIGRLHWRSLKVRDRRDVAEPDAIFAE